MSTDEQSTRVAAVNSSPMMSNLDRYKKDLKLLILTGKQLEISMEAECAPEKFKSASAEIEKKIAAMPLFASEHQRWYSEAKALIKQLLPDRLADFVRYYEKPKPRKNLTNENYCIEDFLQGLTVCSRDWAGEEETVVARTSAIPLFRQQLAILKAVRARFESSLFDIRQLVMADLFDSELDATEELAKKKFLRGAGAMAGVVLEKHLRQVCRNHSIQISKKAPTINDLNELLKAANVVDVPQWRLTQRLGDIRNLCDHNKTIDPTAEQVTDLIAGVAKTIKTLF